ncbi:MAG: hypothetical protein AB7I27_11730 [Bacteriovoracaceae bacterium]
MKKLISTSLMTVGILFSQVGMTSVPTLALTFDTNVNKINMSSSQEAKVQSAEEKMRSVIGSSEFKNRVINFTYNGKKQFLNNGGLTNTQIYYKILNGAEKLYPSLNNAMDMGMKLYYENSSTVGWTSPSLSYINVNTKYFNTYTSSKVAGNMMHEWLHKLGFTHTSYYTSVRKYSVPYAIGYIMAELAAKY